MKQGPHDIGTDDIALRSAAPYATLVIASCSRIVVDVNRYPEPSRPDPDPSADPEKNRERDSDRAVPLHLRDRIVWRSTLTEREIRRRVREYHTPFHRALGREISRIRRRKRPVLLVDLHSMSDATFDFILGDNGGRSAGRHVCLAVRRLLGESCQVPLSRIGYAGIEVWDPGCRGGISPALLAHTGGFITINYGNPRERLYALQIEISRALFTGLRTGKIRRKQLDRLAIGMRDFFQRLAALAEEPDSLFPPGGRRRSRAVRTPRI